jgi:hypothetical protein
MKKLILLIVVLAGALIGVNYMRTGKVGLFPPAVSVEERQLRDLEKQLEAVKAQMSQAGRTASMTGADTTADMSALMEKKAKLEKQIEEARKKLR